MHIHKTEYGLGEIIYLKTDIAQLKRIVIAITIKINNTAYYEIGCGAESSFHFEFEMTKEADQNIQLGIT